MNKLFSRLSQLKLCSAFSDEETGEQQQQQRANNSTALTGVSQNPFLDAPESATAVEYKKGYVMRKCCYDTSFKKSAFPIISQSKKNQDKFDFFYSTVWQTLLENVFYNAARSCFISAQGRARLS